MTTSSLGRCVNHPLIQETLACESCKRPFCERCLEARAPKFLCAGCHDVIVTQQALTERSRLPLPSPPIASARTRKSSHAFWAWVAAIAAMTGTLAFIAVIMVSFGIPYYNARTERQRNQTINQLAQVGAALEAYHHANARYPDELQELVPKFLKQFPNDAFGAPLIYRRENGHAPVLYSMGANGADDGGVFVGDGSNDGDLVYGVDQPDVGGTTP